MFIYYMNRSVVGEGAYGCVHKPSLQCINPPKPNFDYKDYVSKIMKTKNARIELNEFVVMQELDPNDEYHLGKPEICKPILNENVKKDIEKCKNIKYWMISYNSNANPKKDKFIEMIQKYKKNIDIKEISLSNNNGGMGLRKDSKEYLFICY